MKKMKMMCNVEIFRNKKVLMSFFDKDFTHKVKKIFEGYAELIICKNKKDMLKYLTDKKIDILIIDFVYEQNYNLTLSKEIKEKYPTLPIIGVCSPPVGEVKHYTESIKLKHLITRPTSIEILENTMERLLS